MRGHFFWRGNRRRRRRQCWHDFQFRQAVGTAALCRTAQLRWPCAPSQKLQGHSWHLCSLTVTTTQNDTKVIHIFGQEMGKEGVLIVFVLTALPKATHDVSSPHLWWQSYRTTLTFRLGRPAPPVASVPGVCRAQSWRWSCWCWCVQKRRKNKGVFRWKNIHTKRKSLGEREKEDI